MSRQEALLISGVDNLSSRDVVEYVERVAGVRCRIEWVDDSSVVCVFAGEPEALAARELLAPGSDGVVPAATVPYGGDVELVVRVALESDRKRKNAREFSRYYLLNGEPERVREKLGELFPAKVDEANGYLGFQAPLRSRNLPVKHHDELFPDHPFWDEVEEQRAAQGDLRFAAAKADRVSDSRLVAREDVEMA